MTRPDMPDQFKTGYFTTRWNGQVPPGTLVWRDMLVVGTLVNAMTGLVSLILLARGVHSGAWAALHLILLPYNLFLLLAIWRTAVNDRFLRLLAACWFSLMLFV